MSRSLADPSQEPVLSSATDEPRLLARLSPVVVIVALILALATFAIFAGFTPIPQTSEVVLTLFAADSLIILVLFVLVVHQAIRLRRARRAQQAGASLHMRIVTLFSIIAAVPALIMAFVATTMLEQGFDPKFMSDLRGFVGNTAEAARLYRDSQCKSLLREADLAASLLSSGGGKALFDYDRRQFKTYFTNNVKALGFTSSALIKRDGSIVERPDVENQGVVASPETGDFADAEKGEPVCLITDDNVSFVALRALRGFNDLFLYAARPIDPFATQFERQAEVMISLYSGLDQHRRTIEIAFAIMFGLLAAIMLLSAVWLAIGFANGLVSPLRRLIRATDQVASGNLYVQVPISKREGDLAHLGETFNKMTSELRHKENNLMAASALIDERRMFTEAVLSGVPAEIIGVDARGIINVLNPSASKLLDVEPAQGAGARILGRQVVEILPELTVLLAEAQARARHANGLVSQGQISLNRGGRERILHVRITSEPSARTDRGFVITLDDISDLVSAQRTSAWADVARRIAHEIKNPLTPIQLSAERLKRKYSKLITQDREIFDQCTDTIVRQVDDIKRMVDEFSSFARMPKARLEDGDLGECLRQVLFLMRVGHPDITFTERFPEQPMRARFDRRLISQALTNIIKNASEGIAGLEESGGPAGRIEVSLEARANGTACIDVTDNGRGFPTENRQRLLEPYMTTRAEGTGLGLPIVAKILEDHGGRIELLDAPPDWPGGRGARVRLVFPLASPALPTRPETASPPRPHRLGQPSPVPQSVAKTAISPV